jgi:hypothetical protein
MSAGASRNESTHIIQGTYPAIDLVDGICGHCSNGVIKVKLS